MRVGLAKVTGGLVGLAVIAIGASWIAGSVMVAGHHSRVAPAAQPSRDFRIATRDGVTVAATFTPGSGDRSPAVLILHGVGASRQATAENAAWLASVGYATLTIDFRGHGQSDLAARTFGIREAADAQAAFQWLKHRQGGAPVAVIGISLGGAAALLGDEGPLQADALILQAVYADIRRAIRNRIASRLSITAGYLLEPLLSFQARLRFGVWPSRLSPLNALRHYRGHVLVIGGEEDRSTPADESRAMFAAVRGPKQLWLVPRGDHAEICGLADAAYRHHLQDFLARTIGNPER